MQSPFSPYCLALSVVTYASLTILHERIIRARTAAELRAEFYGKGVMRLEDRWAGTGDAGERYRDPKHVYAEDLDLFGYGGLFELLSTARTPRWPTHAAYDLPFTQLTSGHSATRTYNGRYYFW